MGTHRHTQTAYVVLQIVRAMRRERFGAMIHTAAAMFTAVKGE
jgi:hypothetical protein